MTSPVRHTPGPWSYVEYGGHIFKAPDGLRIFTIDSKTPRSWEEHEANARRIVACVNACEGMNPEAIPKLVAALRDISTPRLGGSGGSPEGAELARCISVAADAIADASLSA